MDSTLSRRQFLAAGAAATFVPFPQESWGASNLESLIERKRAVIRKAISDAGIPGGTVALIHEGKVVWTEGFGVTDRTSARPVDPRTIFSIQSTSKHFTATAIMLAVQKGVLDLDVPITTYVPEFTVHSRFERDPQKKMTLRLLLSHRTGFTHEAPVGSNYNAASPSFDAHVRSISDTWLRYPVNERFAYSNLGIDVAGYILQKVAGMPFTTCLKTLIFDPLGMADSTCDAAVYGAQKNRAVGHDSAHDRVPLEIPIIPSGGVYTSAKDMAAYALFHLNRGRVGDRQLLAKELWQEMHSFPHEQPHGLCVLRDQARYGKTIVDKLNHNGGGFGFMSAFSFYPQAGLAWFACFNQPAPGGYDALKDDVCDEILQRAYGKKKPLRLAQDLKTVDVSKQAQDQFVGNYLGRGGELFKIERVDGVLGMRLNDEFHSLRFTSPVDAYLTDTSGQVAPLHLEPANELRPKFLRCPQGPSFGDLDYNDGPSDPPGPNQKEWRKYVGDYRLVVWDKPLESLQVHIKNGYLHIDERRLIVEHEPGLFFSADGEALDFRQGPPRWFNVILVPRR
jgi:CubicO group peptidase (beta-lactamase class C family)